MTRRVVITVALVLLSIGAARFMYALTRSPQGWSGITHMDRMYDLQRPMLATAGDEPQAFRFWGPLFFPAFGSLRALALPDPIFRASIRVLLVLLYALSVFLLARAALPSEWSGRSQPAAFTAVLAFLSLQSSAAIYAISNGQAEIVAGFLVVAHFYFFVQKQYLAAAATICIAVYFKLWPILFLWPYALMSLFSPAQRRYVACLAVAGLAVAAMAFAAGGWRLGLLYPLTMILDVMTTGTLVPIESREVFGLVFFVSRLASKFAIDASQAQDLVRTQAITTVATLFLFVSTSAIALLFARTATRWNEHMDSRRAALLLFQAVIGFLAVSFSVDVSITHLLMIMVSLYWPLWLLTSGGGQDMWTPGRALLVGVPYGVGIVLVGNLIPLSLLFRVLPLGWIHGMFNAGNPMVEHEQYLWYQVPLVGICLIALSLGLAYTVVRRASHGQKLPQPAWAP